MTENRFGPTEDWCLTHNKPVTRHFVAAVCPNDAGCQVVPRPAFDARWRHAYECPHCGGKYAPICDRP